MFNGTHELEFTTSDRRVVLIRYSDDGETIDVADADGNKIGKCELLSIDGEYYHLTRMYLDILNDSYRRQGIGRAVLTHHRKVFQLPICVSPDDGQQRNDGSHLTGDAPAFIRAMKREGLVSEHGCESVVD